MILSFEQITSITQGASRIEEKNGYISFYRFNKKEEDLYSKTEFFRKTFSTAGIQFEFKTDGNVLALTFKTSAATTRTYFAFDVFVNGNKTNSIKNFDDSIKNTDYIATEFALGDYSSKVDLGKGEKTVKIVFPWSVKTELSEIEIENATYIEPVKKNKKILMYGDSITNGYDALYPSNAYAIQFADFLDAEIFNKAIGGEIFFPQLAEIKNDINPDYITVAYGTNDWAISEQEDFKKRCNEFFKALTRNYPNTAIFALTPIWRANFELEKKFGNFSDVEKIIKNVCSDYKNITVLTGWELVPHNENYYADLRVHPNDEGFEHYAKNLIEKFKNI